MGGRLDMVTERLKGVAQGCLLPRHGTTGSRTAIAIDTDAIASGWGSADG
jgi:hypothetical protein